MAIEVMLTSHLSSTSLVIINTSNEPTHVVYGSPSRIGTHELIRHDGHVTCTCVSVDGTNTTDVNAYADIIIAGYINSNGGSDVQFTDHEWYLDLKYTCTLYDGEAKQLWMISDTIGSSPLWYSFSTNGNDDANDSDDLKYIATTDLILAHRLGFSFLTPLGPGQVIGIDLNVNEITNLYQWQSDLSMHLSAYEDLHDAQLYAYRLMSSAMHTISNYSSPIDIEVDPIIPSSLLLDCALSTIGMDYSVHISQAIVSDSIIPESDRFHVIMEGAGDPRHLMTSVWAPKFMRVAADRWTLCEGSKSKIIVSHDSGMHPRPLEVYLQNLFCSALGVRVLYPFRGLDFQLKSWGTGYPHSFSHNAVYVLREPFSCSSYGPRTFSSESSGYSSEVNEHVHGSRSSSSSSSNSSSNSSNSSNSSSSESTLGNLWKVANEHASPDKYIVLVLATSGYSDLLQNFLCSTSKLGSRNVVVVTPNDDIAEIARAAGIGYIISSSWKNVNLNVSIADFGTILYQELMLFRTETVMNLLLLGFNPIIADIDTVWLDDPLNILRSEQQLQKFDIAVTDDRGEVCGCFVALHNTEASVMLWKQVALLHRQLIVKGRQQPEAARDFSDSEQKILTNLLLHKGYDKRLLVCVLPNTAFPSGYHFFNLRNSINDISIGQPVIVHNNYIIGKGIKRIRFARYNLWSVKHSKGLGLLQCNYNPLHDWELLADGVEKDIRIPILSLVLPIHNSMIHTSLLMAQAHTEGSEYNISIGRFWLETTPPNFISFHTLGVYQLDVKKSNNINSLSIILDGTSIAISADVGVNRSTFSFDRNGKSHEAANERVLKAKRTGSPDSPKIKCYMCDPVSLFNEKEVDSTGALETAANSNSFQLNIAIKVLAYNRPASLARLLQSLADADYLGHYISLEIFVDYAASDEDLDLVEATCDVARGFLWSHGTKELTFRDVNYGLARQWYSAWNPTLNSEVAFVFEDDLEVSPLFFVWSYRALQKYYVDDEDQRQLQMQLLEAVKRHVKSNGTSSQSSGDFPFPSTIEEFVTMTAGDPVMYGLCLQKQHLDPARYPKMLEIRNGYRPYLYSLIGSWGPLLLPSPWLAFKEWWLWKWERSQLSNSDVDLNTENTVINHFLNTNPRIWTPWMVRFAFETGAKCLYPNLPGNLSLVSNHRERGENYDRTLGPDSKHLTRDDVDNVRKLVERDDYITMTSSNTSTWHRFIAETSSDRFTLALHRSINYLPPLTSLIEWQYDLNLRRAGSLGSDRLLAHSVDSTNTSSRGIELLMADEIITSAKNWYAIALSSSASASASSTASSTAPCAEDKLVLMTNEHWVEVISLLEANVFVGASFVHLGLSPLTRLLVNRYPLHVVVNTGDTAITDISMDMIGSKRIRLINIGTDDALDKVPTSKFDAVIVHLPSLSNGLTSDSFRRLLKQIVFEYLLILSNSCSGSPTDLHFDTRAYTLVEDVCAEASVDVGASLFRQVLNDTKEEWHKERYMISRRLKTDTGILVTRRAVTSHSSSLFV